MTKLIFNADDYGYCEGVNYGIISAHKKGVVTSCTVMANMPGFEHGIELLKETPTLSCGVHMTLTCYKPLLENHKTIVQDNGYFYKKATQEFFDKIDLDEVYKEFCAQIDKVKNKIDITHLDSHHHVHGMTPLHEVIQAVADKYKLPMRQYNNEIINGITQVPLIGDFYLDNVSIEYFKKKLEIFKSKDLADVMCHPAFIDSFLNKSTSYLNERVKEHEVLTSSELKKIFLDNGIELVNYSIVK